MKCKICGRENSCSSIICPLSESKKQEQEKTNLITLWSNKLPTESKKDPWNFFYSIVGFFVLGFMGSWYFFKDGEKIFNEDLGIVPRVFKASADNLARGEISLYFEVYNWSKEKVVLEDVDCLISINNTPIQQCSVKIECEIEPGENKDLKLKVPFSYAEAGKAVVEILSARRPRWNISGVSEFRLPKGKTKLVFSQDIYVDGYGKNMYI
jgi:hypothetical protein